MSSLLCKNHEKVTEVTVDFKTTNSRRILGTNSSLIKYRTDITFLRNQQDANPVSYCIHLWYLCDEHQSNTCPSSRMTVWIMNDLSSQWPVARRLLKSVSCLTVSVITLAHFY